MGRWLKSPPPPILDSAGFHRTTKLPPDGGAGRRSKGEGDGGRCLGAGARECPYGAGLAWGGPETGDADAPPDWICGLWSGRCGQRRHARKVSFTTCHGMRQTRRRLCTEDRAAEAAPLERQSLFVFTAKLTRILSKTGADHIMCRLNVMWTRRVKLSPSQNLNERN